MQIGLPRIFRVPGRNRRYMIQVLQSLDPIGVGAKDLTDCLLIQLRELEDYNELAYTIDKKH
ncbi:DNA-directed RNA polymerase specialized sigma54-like protein [Peribacillus simplex]